MSDSSPSLFHVIDDLDAIKVIADPIRHQLLTLLSEPKSVKQLAAEIGRPPDRLYYHLRKLIDIGVVVEASRREINGITERTWKLVGPIKINAAGLDPATTDRLLGTTLGLITAGLTDPGPSPTPGRAMLSLTAGRVRPADRDELARRLQAVLGEFTATDPAGGDDHPDSEWIGIFAGYYVLPDDQRGDLTGPVPPSRAVGPTTGRAKRRKAAS